LEGALFLIVLHDAIFLASVREMQVSRNLLTAPMSRRSRLKFCNIRTFCNLSEFASRGYVFYEALLDLRSPFYFFVGPLFKVPLLHPIKCRIMSHVLDTPLTILATCSRLLPLMNLSYLLRSFLCP
jgi:hypothetical protein